VKLIADCSWLTILFVCFYLCIPNSLLYNPFLLLLFLPFIFLKLKHKMISCYPTRSVRFNRHPICPSPDKTVHLIGRWWVRFFLRWLLSVLNFLARTRL
jgi:hypothetical protein